MRPSQAAAAAGRIDLKDHPQVKKKLYCQRLQGESRIQVGVGSIRMAGKTCIERSCSFIRIVIGLKRKK